MSFDEIFAPGMRYWQEQKDFEEDDAHHATAEGNPFDSMLDDGAVVLRGTKVPRPEKSPDDAPDDDEPHEATL